MKSTSQKRTYHMEARAQQVAENEISSNDWEAQVFPDLTKMLLPVRENTWNRERAVV